MQLCDSGHKELTLVSHALSGWEELRRGEEVRTGHQAERMANEASITLTSRLLSGMGLMSVNETRLTLGRNQSNLRSAEQK